ncbi:MAG: acyltransferase [Methylobacter sp.]|uniref:Acyltransferase n=1 Tax=Candidatus Methylobacter titanis TaxID=3053457 RepID=A0AA43TME1_9GAMM|nr:acyltransferase [Candidatus Methylobacter titanis]
MKNILNFTKRIFFYIQRKIFIKTISAKNNIKIEGNINLINIPIIDIKPNSSLLIENNVTLNSNNNGYHINMHSPVKLMADRDGAVIKIGQNTRINGTCIHAYKSISIGRNCLIAANCQIIDGNGHDLSFPDVENRINTKGNAKEITIEDNVWIGANTFVLPGVRIGMGSVISANSVVKDDIPSMVIAGGNPAVIIKKYSIIND